MDNISCEIHYEYPGKHENESVTKCVQHFCHIHIEGLERLDEQFMVYNQKVIFIMVNQDQHMHLVYDKQLYETGELEIFKQ